MAAISSIEAKWQGSGVFGGYQAGSYANAREEANL